MVEPVRGHVRLRGGSVEAVWRQHRAGTWEGAVKGGCQGWLSRAAAAAAACTGQQQRAVVVACDRASDPSTWVGTRRSGPWTCGRRPEHRRGLSMGAVNGGGHGGGMYRAAATRRCGWGHGSRGPGLGTRGWQKRRHCGWGMHPRCRASWLWSAMSHPL